MSKERLEEIKKLYNFWMKEDESIGLLPEDIEWLIEQTERVQELNRDSEYLRDVFIPFLQANVAELERQNKHYREIFDELASLDEPNHDEDFYGTNEFFMKFNKLIKRAYEGELE